MRLIRIQTHQIGAARPPRPPLRHGCCTAVPIPTSEELILEKPHPNEVSRSHKEKKPLSVRAEGKKLKEYRQWLLTHKSTSTAMEKLFLIALDDDHAGQMQALKILSDRVMPLSGFAAENQHSRTPSVQINITGYNDAEVKEVPNDIDGHLSSDSDDGEIVNES